MTRRVLAGFISVLIAMIVFVEVPLGLELASHERDDFRQTTQARAQSLASSAEEVLGDADQQSAGARLQLSIDPGDAAVVANRTGVVIARFGPTIPTSAITAALSGRPAHIDDRTTVSANVGDGAARDGTIVLARDSAPLERRLDALAAALTIAAAGALALGAAVAVALARWIAMPIHGLRQVATSMGAGELGVRAPDSGPPEIRELAADFNLMADRIGDLLDNQRAITSDVSHQLRTPLAALRLRLENLLAEPPMGLQPDLAATLEEINRLSRLADGLLAVARAEDNAVAAEAITVSAVIGERIALWHEVADEKAVTLVDESEELTALAQLGHLDQILDNLLANALDAVARESTIEVRTTRQGDMVLIAVVDHGPGLPLPDRERAFRRFSGLGDRTPRSAGLGLAIVGSLAKASHGTATLEETPGGGLTVSISLPVARRSGESPEAEEPRGTSS
jgi:signal transduction histidine kinase